MLRRWGCGRHLPFPISPSFSIPTHFPSLQWTEDRRWEAGAGRDPDFEGVLEKDGRELVSNLSCLPAPQRGTLDSTFRSQTPLGAAEVGKRTAGTVLSFCCQSVQSSSVCVADRRASLLRGCLLCVSLKLRDLAQARAQAESEVGGEVRGTGRPGTIMARAEGLGEAI